MRVAIVIIGMTVLIPAGVAMGQVPVWHNTLEDAASSTVNGGAMQGSAPVFVPGIVSPPLSTVNKFQSTGDSRVFWGTSAVQTIFGGWVDGNGITVDLYFSGFGPGVARDSGLWSVGHRTSDNFFIIAIRDDTVRINLRNESGPGGAITHSPQSGNLGLIASETYRLTVRQHADNGNGSDLEVYLDDLGGSVYSAASPLFTYDLPSGFVFNFPLEAGAGPGLGMNIGSRHPFDAAATRLKSGEAVDEVRVFNGNYTPAELDAGGQPTAVISADVASGPAPLTVDFDGSGSFDLNGGTIVAWAWDFEGDGGSPDSTLADPSPYTYSVPGLYNASLTVTDNDSNTNTTSIQIRVYARLAITAITPDGGPLTGTQPVLSLTSGGNVFADLIGPDIVELDGAMSSEQNTGLCDLTAADSMLGIEMGRGISGFGAGERIRGFFPAGAVINADGTDKPEIFVLEYANSSDTFTVELLTSGPGVPPVVAGTALVLSTDYAATTTRMAAFSNANSPIGGMGIDLDAVGVTGITGVQLIDDTGLDPVAIVAVDPAGTLIPPVVTMLASPTSGGFPLIVNFGTCPAYDVDGPIVSYAWDFTNNGDTDATGPTAVHTYPVAGTYTAKVTVTDDDGLTTSDTVSIVISGPNPKRQIIAMLPSGALPSGSHTLASVTTEMPGSAETFTATDLVGPPDTAHVDVFGSMNGGGAGATTPQEAMVGLELGSRVSSLDTPGEFLTGYFPDDVVVNADGTAAPEIFVIEASTSTDVFQIELLTSSAGQPPEIAASIQIVSTDYASTTTTVGGEPRGGVGIDLDALGLSGIRGVRIPGADGLGGGSGIDPVLIAGVPTRCGTPFADTDGDGDVDHADFAVFQLCFTGGPPVPGVFDAVRCLCLDRDADQDVDELDYSDFENCASSPGVAADPCCAGGPGCS